MKLLTETLRKALPPLYATDGKPDTERKVPVKFFNPAGMGTWYALEFDGEDRFFGFVNLFEKELGYFTLSELENVKLPFGLGIERDLHWNPDTTLDKVMNGEAT